MSQWIDFAALAKILHRRADLRRRVCPPCSRSACVRLHMGAPAPVPAGAPGCSSRRRATDARVERLVGGSPLGIAIAGLCFAVVLAAIGWGIYLIVAGT